MLLRAALCLLILSVCRGQDAPAGAKNLLLDLVVRDKKGRPITNLEPSDLEIYDNGVRQNIASLRLVEANAPRIVTLIYDRLDLNSRGLARKTSLDFLKNDFPPHVLLSVLTLDEGIRAVQPFTADRDLLKKAVGQATGAALTQYAPRPGGTLSELLAVLNQQATRPGRKTILFFSSGFDLPEGNQATWTTLISMATRFHVSFYPTDSRGLNTANENSESLSEMKDAATASQLKTLTHGNSTITPTIARSQDIVVGSKSKEAHTLAALARSTGGFPISSAGDLRKLNEDIRSYYEITYNSGAEPSDGSFRKIEVRGTRPNLRIQSPAGYFANPSGPK
jgi:VWFA-related protein